MTASTNAHEPAPAMAESTSQPAAQAAEKPKKKDWMDVLQALSSVLVPLTVALVGFLASNYLERRQTEDTKSRFYIDLLSQREGADSALRQTMFNTFINNFIDSKFNDPRRQVLGLELLEANFHESIDLSPLFRDIATQLRDTNAVAAPELMSRLKWITQEVKDKQTVALTGAGGLQIQMDPALLEGLPLVDSGDVEPVTLWDHDTELPADPLTNGAPIKAHITVLATAVNPRSERVHIKLTITKTSTKASSKTNGETSPAMAADLADIEFWLGAYDLPVLNNTRLTESLRCALVLNEFSIHKPSQIALLIFPASRASTKDKPYLDEMISQTLPQPKATGSQR